MRQIVASNLAGHGTGAGVTGHSANLTYEVVTFDRVQNRLRAAATAAAVRM